MVTFFMFGTYSRDAMKSIAAKRTAKAEELINGFGGKLRSVYVLLGQYDLIILADFPTIHEALHASVELTKQTGIAFSTHAALTVADFDMMFE